MNKFIQYNPVGSRFVNDDPHLPGEELRVVEQAGNEPSCKGCYYAKKAVRSCSYHACTPYLRKDKRHVIFIQCR